MDCGRVVARILGNSNFFLGVTAMAVAFFSLLFALSWGDVSLVAPAAGVAYVHRQRLRRENLPA